MARGVGRLKTFAIRNIAAKKARRKATKNTITAKRMASRIEKDNTLRTTTARLQQSHSLGLEQVQRKSLRPRRLHNVALASAPLLVLNPRAEHLDSNHFSKPLCFERADSGRSARFSFYPSKV